MKVLRTQKLVTKNVEVGDQIIIILDGFGKFTATAQRITDEGILFMFDDCITERPMNEEHTNKGGFENSDLCRWLNEELIKAFPKKLQKKIKSISLPTYGQIFGHEDEFYDKFEPDQDERFQAMKNRKNRLALLDGCLDWYWLQNPTKEEVSSANFAVVNGGGAATCSVASYSFGVRPVVLLVN